MTRTRRRLSDAAAAAAIVGAALVLAGCGTGGLARSSDSSGGKELFVEKCGSCHALADAGTTGKIGPDLDAAFGPSREQGFEESTIRQVVRDQIHLPSPGTGEPGFPEMPADLVTGDDAEAVSAYVASVAGQSATSGSTTTAGATGATTTGATATTGAETTTGATTTGAETTPGATTTAAAEGGAGDAAKGKSLYSSLACGSCHSIDGSAGVGPTLKGVFGSKEQLANGRTVTADVAYLMESIEEPDAEIVKGYQPGIMSATIKPHQVAEADARDLVAYIKSLK